MGRPAVTGPGGGVMEWEVGGPACCHQAGWNWVVMEVGGLGPEWSQTRWYGGTNSGGNGGGPDDWKDSGGRLV